MVLKKFEVKDEVEVITVEAIHLENKEFFAIQADYFENEGLAEKEGFYWEDKINKWTKEILDNTTTIF